MDDKMCPLKLIAHAIRPCDSSEYVSCEKQNCAWWLTANGMTSCAIKILARSTADSNRKK